MLTKEQWTDWRENSEWFFDILEEKQGEILEQLGNVTEQWLEKPFTSNDRLKELAIDRKARLDVVQSLLKMSYDDFAEDYDLENNDE